MISSAARINSTSRLWPRFANAPGWSASSACLACDAASARCTTSGGGVYNAVPCSVPEENEPFSAHTSGPIGSGVRRGLVEQLLTLLVGAVLHAVAESLHVVLPDQEHDRRLGELLEPRDEVRRLLLIALQTLLVGGPERLAEVLPRDVVVVLAAGGRRGGLPREEVVDRAEVGDGSLGGVAGQARAEDVGPGLGPAVRGVGAGRRVVGVQVVARAGRSDEPRRPARPRGPPRARCARPDSPTGSCRRPSGAAARRRPSTPSSR